MVNSCSEDFKILTLDELLTPLKVVSQTKVTC